MNKRLIDVSKTISYALRHRPNEFGLSLDKEGWVDFEVFCRALASYKHPVYVDKEIIEKIITESDKKRFELINGKIRATYGHSIDTKIEFKKSIPPNILFHGTSHKAYDLIRKEGLKPMNRQYVHLSVDAVTARKVGSRHDRNPVILVINSSKMYLDGFKFFHSTNDGTWMCESVPSSYITRAIIY